MAVKQDADLRAVKGDNFAAINTGKLANLDTYKLEVPALKRTVSGKLFVKDFLDSTSVEISMNKLPAGIAIPFYHAHKENEETYIFISGNGQMQIDGETFDVSEGTIVRVSPKGMRTIRNNSSGDLIYICIQAKDGSLKQATIGDGVRGDAPVVWPN